MSIADIAILAIAIIILVVGIYYQINKKIKNKKAGVVNCSGCSGCGPKSQCHVSEKIKNS